MYMQPCMCATGMLRIETLDTRKLSYNKEQHRPVVTSKRAVLQPSVIWDRPTQSQPSQRRPGGPLPHANLFPAVPEECQWHPACRDEPGASQVNSCWELLSLAHVASNKLDFNGLNRQKKIAPCSCLLPSLGLASVNFCHSTWLPAPEIRDWMQRGACWEGKCLQQERLSKADDSRKPWTQI